MTLWEKARDVNLRGIKKDATCVLVLLAHHEGIKRLRLYCFPVAQKGWLESHSLCAVLDNSCKLSASIIAHSSI